VQIAAFRDMSPERRMEITAQMSEEIRSITRAGIVYRHPDYSPDEVSRELLSILFGKELTKSLGL